MTAEISVMVPVGPYAVYKKWLAECLESVQAQTLQPSEVLLVDDMANVELADVGRFADRLYWPPRSNGECHLLREGVPVGRVWRAPWRLGGVGAFNCGVALAKSDLVFMLSCDDKIRPECLELCVAEWEKAARKDAYYYVGAHYMGNEWPDQTVPFSGAMVTKGLWRAVGGFPVETASGAGDAALVSILTVHFSDCLIPVAHGAPLYDYRVHNQTDTANSGPWQGVIGETRGLVTNLWKAPEWGRLE